MNPLQVIVTAVLATLSTLALGVVAAWSLWPKTAEAGVAVAAHSSAWAAGELSHCEHFSGEHIKFGEAVVSAALDLNDHQEDSLAAVTAELEAWRAQAQTTCLAADLTTLDGGLAGMQTLLRDSAQALAELRPLIDEFYAGLDTSQQSQLKAFLHNHHGRHRFSHHSH